MLVVKQEREPTITLKEDLRKKEELGTYTILYFDLLALDLIYTRLIFISKAYSKRLSSLKK
jgi:hypothetical protein